MLHLLNGDAVLPSLRASGLPGELAVWGDVLWEGPLLPGRPRIDEIQARAAYFSAPGEDPAPLITMQGAWDRGLAAAAGHDEVVLWLEHDLHDQFLLLRHLDHFSRQPHANLRLICIDAFPGVVPFHGLGQLDGAQLASLFPARRPVTTAQLRLGSEAWAAVQEASPRAIAAFLQRDTSALPFLAGAIQRFLEEYPAPNTGLGRTEAVILEALMGRSMSGGELFRLAQAREERVFMGDWSFAQLLRGLAEGPSPLVRIEEGRKGGGTLNLTATITSGGRAVLAGQGDRVALTGIERWLGGVHLHGRAVDWRWDRVSGRLVP